VRLRQEYFFVAASLQDLVNVLAGMGKYVAGGRCVQLNDTHLVSPSRADAICRLHNIRWDDA